MRAFLTPNPSAFGELARRAVGQCVRFRGRHIPGAQPETVDVGFEVDAESGHSILWLQMGVQWRVADPTVQQWLRQGRMDFETFDELQAWMLGPLRQAYATALAAVNRQPMDGVSHEPNSNRPELTDWRVVEQGMGTALEADMVVPDQGELYGVLAQSVFGQEHALRTLAQGCSQHLGKSAPNRPAVFFALGPTGVGKTRSAEALAEAMNHWCADDAKWRTLRLDMSEYQEAHRVSQLIGAPQGYLGYGENSQLVDALTQSKRWVIVFDEIEKAHPGILKLLMNAMDAGRISTASNASAQGHQLDCRECIFFFTSNLEAGEVLKELEHAPDKASDDAVCRRRLKTSGGIAPEIVERIEHFLVYRQIPQDQRANVMLTAIAETAREYGLELCHVAPELLLNLLREARSHNNGARADRRLVGEKLGAAFVQARREGMREVKLSSDPVCCVPAEGADQTPAFPE